MNITKHKDTAVAPWLYGSLPGQKPSKDVVFRESGRVKYCKWHPESITRPDETTFSHFRVESCRRCISRLTTPKRCHLTAVDLRGCSSGTVGITATGRTPHGEGTSSPQARPRRVVGPGIGFLHSRSRCVLMWQETIHRGSKTWGRGEGGMLGEEPQV